MKTARAIIVALLVVFVLAAVGVGVVANAYSGMKTDFKTSSVSPQVNVSLGTIASGVLDLFKGDYLAAATSVITGLDVQGQIAFQNRSFIPIYVPAMEHEVKIEGQPSKTPIQTTAFWLGPGATVEQPFQITIAKSSIPTIAFQALANGGTLTVDVDSSFPVAGFTLHKSTSKAVDVTHAVSSGSSNTPAIMPPSVATYSWSPNAVSVGSSATISITMSGGSAGTYTLEVLKDVFGSDPVLQSFPISHNGNKTSNRFSFDPGDAGSYYVHLKYGGNTIWSQPNDSSRLSVQSVSNTTSATAPLSVTSYNWSPNTVSVGSSATISITLSGGTSGTYTLEVLQDLFGTDPVLQVFSIAYGGSSTTNRFSFTPTGAGSYYFHLKYDGNTVWSQPNDTSRLSVQSVPTTTTAPLTVTSYGWSPNAVSVGSSATVSITLSGGSAGTYTLEVLQDFLGTDSVVQSSSISHDGNVTTNRFSFTPTGAGSYYVHLKYGGSTIWSQPNDTSRLIVQSVPTTTSSTAPLSVTSYNWSPNTINVGSSATVSVTLSGGSAGTYTLEVLKDLFGDDPVLQSFAISYGGNSITSHFSFTPTSTGSYYIHLKYGGNTVWSQPNDTSRLSVQSVPTTTTVPLSITSYNWSPSTVSVGGSATISITLSGGSAGTYTLEILKDVLGTDPVLQSFAISYGGNSTTSRFSFTPTGAGSYYVHLKYGGNTIWSQPNDATRLKVN